MRCIAVLKEIPSKKHYKTPSLRRSEITRKSEYITYERADNDIIAQFHNATIIASCFKGSIEI